MSLETAPDRLQDATQLLEDFQLTQDAEFFSLPVNRLEFLQSLDHEDFTGITQHVNARVRGFEPRDKVNAHDAGAFLPLLGTPSQEEKPGALRAGFDTISKYLRESEDTVEQKLHGASMAVEALVVWVHPFDDGNGRTSRFLGKFIEDGTTDTGQLIAETADGGERMRMYPSSLRVDQANIFKNQSAVIFDDETIDKIKKTEMPVEDGISLSIKRLLEDKTYQNKVDAITEKYRARKAKDNDQNSKAS